MCVLVNMCVNEWRVYEYVLRMHEGRGVCDDACVCEWACTEKGVVCLMMHASMNGCVCTRVHYM